MLRHRRSAPRPSVAEEQFRQLVDDHAEAVYRVAYSVVRDQHLAEDVVQETIIKAWQGFEGWRGDGSPRPQVWGAQPQESQLQVWSAQPQ